MQRNGVSYDVGRHLYGDWRKDYDPQTVHRELEIIKNDLHCNAIRICGKDLERLETSAKDALQQGLEVWLSPDLWNKSPGQTLAYLIKAAEVAERLRIDHPDQIVLNVGSELTLFMKGIIKGNSMWARMRTAFQSDFVRSGQHNKPLNDFLFQAVSSVRHVFKGPLTYASLPFEDVDWDLFDIIGIDHYRATAINDRYGEMLRPLIDLGKPVAIMEFGCCAYQGAEKNTGHAFDIINTKSLALSEIPLFGRFFKPRLKSIPVRDEMIQTHEVITSLDVFNEEGVYAAFVFCFIDTLHLFNEDPLNDLDRASYSLVKSYGSGTCGSTYPDMTWDPKEAFTAVAQYYEKQDS